MSELRCSETQESLVAGRKTSMNVTHLSCDICGVLKNSKPAIRNHCESHLNLTCEACSAILSSIGQLLTHLSKHFRSFACVICDQSFNSEAKFRKHLNKIHDPNVFEKKLQEKKVTKGNFQCRFCNHVLNNKVSLAAHEYRLHKDGRNECQFKCVECGKGFYAKEEFRIHGFEHFKGKLRHCKHKGCDKFFKTGKHLGIHNKTHLPPKHECRMCGARFVQGSGLLKHNKRFCKLQKLKSLQPVEELEKIAMIAEAQFKSLRLKKSKRSDKLMVTKVLKRMEEIKAETGKEILLEVEIIQKKKVKESLAIVHVDIKNEASTDEECWKYEYLDEVLDNSLIVIDDCSVDDPISIELKHEKDEEFVTIKQTYTNIGENANDQVKKCDKIFEENSKNSRIITENLSAKIKRSLKKYNNGMPRKTHLVPRVNRTLLPGESYICDKCGVKFCSWMSIYSHVTTVHKLVGDFKCENCSKFFKTPGNLKRHVQSIHKKIRSYVCHICAQSFTSNSKLTMHFHVHSEPEECKMCGRFVRNIKQHLKRHESSDNRTFLTCPVCGKLYDKFVLPVHIDRVHVKSFNGNVFRCDKCDNEYTRREDLRQHNYTTHFNGKLYQCTKCDKVFHTKRLFRHHHFSHEPANVECKFCEKTFTRRACLYKHRKLKHPETINQEEVSNVKINSQ